MIATHLQDLNQPVGHSMPWCQLDLMLATGDEKSEEPLKVAKHAQLATTLRVVSSTGGEEPYAGKCVVLCTHAPTGCTRIVA